MSADPKYLSYGPGVELIAPDEHVTFDELSRTMQHITRHMATRYRQPIAQYMQSRTAFWLERSGQSPICHPSSLKGCFPAQALTLSS
jgi:hypothetical protein